MPVFAHYGDTCDLTVMECKRKSCSFDLPKRGCGCLSTFLSFYLFFLSVCPSPSTSPLSLLSYCPPAPAPCLTTRRVEENPHYVDNYSGHRSSNYIFIIDMICGTQGAQKNWYRPKVRQGICSELPQSYHTPNALFDKKIIWELKTQKPAC